MGICYLFYIDSWECVTGNCTGTFYSDHYFDGLFCNGLLEHLSDTTKALKEMIRVLKPGGVMGIREAEKSGRLLWPPIKNIQKFLEVADRLVERNGGDPGIGKRVRSLLCQVGLENVEASASFESHGKPESIDTWVDLITTIRESKPVRQMIDLAHFKCVFDCPSGIFLMEN